MAFRLAGPAFDAAAFADALPSRLRGGAGEGGWLSNYWVASPDGFEGALNRVLDAHEPHLRTALSLGMTELRFVVECRLTPPPDLALPPVFLARLEKMMAALNAPSD